MLPLHAYVGSIELLKQLILQDRENEARFGVTPVPGKIGMAMAGQGLHSAPPPRPFGGHAFPNPTQNPGNQLYVGNVRITELLFYRYRSNHSFALSFLTKPVGKT